MGLHFSKEEFSNRKEKTLNSMKNEGADALIMLDKSLCIGSLVTTLSDMFFFKH